MAKIFDTLIIGGGPTGLSTVFYARMRGLDTMLIEAQAELGGQLTVLYPEKPIYDVAGFVDVIARDLVNNLVKQIEQLKPTIQCNTKAVNLEQVGDIFHVTTESGDIIQTRTIIIAGGIGAFSPKKLGKPGEEDYYNKGVIYSVTNLSSLKDKKVLIVGAGDSAFDWAVNLINLAKSITIIHRSDRFRAQSTLIDEILHLTEKGQITLKTFHELKEIQGNGAHTTGAVVYDNRTNEEEYIDAENILINVGFLSNLDFLQHWGIELSENKKGIEVTTNMETNIKGIFACGDITSYKGKVKLITTGFGEGATAANSAFIHIHPDGRLTPAHNVKPSDVMAEVSS